MTGQDKWFTGDTLPRPIVREATDSQPLSTTFSDADLATPFDRGIAITTLFIAVCGQPGNHVRHSYGFVRQAMRSIDSYRAVEQYVCNGG